MSKHESVAVDVVVIFPIAENEWQNATRINSKKKTFIEKLTIQMRDAVELLFMAPEAY